MKFLFVLTAGILLASMSVASQAVYLNAQGMGQVLVYPYYTTNGNNGTLISIVNTTAYGKALKVRFHEGYDGRDVLDFNLYLAPYDTWTGDVALIESGDDVPASIVTTDSSCTVPAFSTRPDIDNMRFLDFSGASYAGSNERDGPTGNSDGGPTDLKRTREGHFDVFEMGEVTNATYESLNAISPVDGVPANCAQIVSAWADGGYWTTNPDADIVAPKGGVYGSEAIIDVEQGTMDAVNPAAIDGFSSTAQNTAPDAPTPDLNTASRSSAGTVSAFVPVNGRMLELDYRKPVDAISALFMADSLYGEFDKDPAVGATTDWVVTAPTKRYYVDPQYVENAIAPFDKDFLATYVVGTYTNADGMNVFLFASAFPFACEKANPFAYDRQGAPTHLITGGEFNIFYTNPSVRPCLETSVLTFSTQYVPPPNGQPFEVPLSALGSGLTNTSDPTEHESQTSEGVDFLPPNGVANLDLTHDANGEILVQHRLAAATNGDVLVGVPMFGFLVTDYVNANVSDGVLANYSRLLPLHAGVTCVNGLNPCQ